MILIFILGIIFIKNNKVIKFSKIPEKIEDISYDINNAHGYKVHINENDILTPYLVLSHDYKGKVLLVRENILEKNHVFNQDISGYAAYYKNSDIDKFLNNEYFKTLDKNIQEKIKNIKIDITKKSCLGITGKGVEKVTRKIFLLSHTELGLKESEIANLEGCPLNYFSDSNKIITYDEKGNSNSWWLRTPCTSYYNSTWGIGPKGSSGAGSVGEENGIRPSFCIDRECKILRKKVNSSEEFIFIIK